MSTNPQTHIGRWWEREADGRLRCDLCPRHCRVRPGQRAFCYVRKGTEDGIELTTYGRSSGFCIDPIEKKPLNHFMPGTSVLSFGTAGCNLGCRFCQNWETSKAREWDRLTDTATPEGIANTARSEGCRSVAFTYNDPVIFAEYAIDVAAACHDVGVKTVAVSAGYITDTARPEFFAAMSATNIDLKAFTEAFYDKLAFGQLGPVLDTLKYVKHETDTWLEITTLLIPGENDSPAELEQLTQWVHDELGPDVPLHFSAFHPDFKLTDRGRTPIETLQRARKIALEAGLNHVYLGNVHDRAGDTTCCPGCGTELIVRDWYELHTYRMKGDQCSACGEHIAGVFEASPGTWGRRRKPVKIGR